MKGMRGVEETPIHQRAQGESSTVSKRACQLVDGVMVAPEKVDSLISTMNNPTRAVFEQTEADASIVIAEQSHTFVVKR